MSENQKQPQQEASQSQAEPAFQVSKSAQVLLLSPLGTIVRKMVAVSASLQNMAMNICSDIITESDMRFIMALGVKEAAEHHQSPQAVIEDLMFVGREMMNLHNDAMQSLATQTVEEALSFLPFVMPENRMLLKTMERGSRVLIVGAPESASAQLRENLPDGGEGGLVDKTAKGTWKGLASELEGRDPDILIVTDFDGLLANDCDDPGAPEKVRASELSRRIAREVSSRRKLSVVMFSKEASEEVQDILSAVGVRVIRWNDEFGPEVFYGKEEATARRSKMVKEIEDRQAEVQKAIADSNTLDDQDGPPEGEPAEDAGEQQEESIIVES